MIDLRIVKNNFSSYQFPEWGDMGGGERLHTSAISVGNSAMKNSNVIHG